MARQSYHTNQTISREELARILHAVGFQGDDIWRMIAIAGRESSYDPGAHGTDQPREKLSGDRGLFQINSTHDQALKDAGIIRSASDLFDPVTNAKAAFYLYQQSGLSPWNAGPGGFTGSGNPLFGTDPTGAQTAYNDAAAAGWDDKAALGYGSPGPSGLGTLGGIAEGLGNLGAPGYRQYATDPRGDIRARRQAIEAALGGRGGVSAPGNPVYYDWQSHPEIYDQYSSFSPHLAMFEKWAIQNYGGRMAEEYDKRPITGGGPPSSHGFGAAFDWQPDTREQGLKLVDLITKNPGAFGIQAIHDYQGGRIWHVDRPGGGDLGGGWKTYDFPAGDRSDTHFHFEVTPQTWDQATPQNWQWMTQAMNGKFRVGGQTYTPEQFGQVARRMGNRGNPLFESYATLAPQVLERRQTRWTTNHPGGAPAAGAGGPQGQPSAALGKLVGDLGIDYPTDKITPTPALITYLAGLGLNMSTAEDLNRVAMNRIRTNTRSTRQDIRTAFRRGKENITADLISRGVLSSGEADKRYTRQTQDRAKQMGDLATSAAQSREDATLAYTQSVQGIQQGGIQALSDLETQQRVDAATNRATARGYRRQARESQRQWEREQTAREQYNQQLIDMINRLGRQGTYP